VKDFVSGVPAGTADDLQPGEGKVLKIDGQAVACFCDDKGKLHAVSATCTHMGCRVDFNKVAKTWDCPCHGSRFDYAGKVIGGPAETPLEKVDVGQAAQR
jgi:Rieske Fe-S protein